MKRISINKVEHGEFYLVYAPEFSASGWEICECEDGMLISQGNNQDITEMADTVFTLPY